MSGTASGYDYLLAYDTSDEILTVGVYDLGSQLDRCTELGYYEAPSFMRHSEVLAPAIERVLKEAKTPLKSIGCIAVGLGAGSFTGLRVGVTMAKTLAYAAKIKLVGVSSLEAIAHEARKSAEGPIAVILDGKKGKIYGAIYDGDSPLREICKPMLTDLTEFLRKIKTDTFFAGSGALLYRDEILGNARFQCRIETQASTPQASAIAEIAASFIRRKKFADPFVLEPLYLHPRDCNVVGRHPKGRG